ncbi:hypothetical protein ACTMTJ_43825 [Phytohabitans sp. LJ34]|uniref:hypothetical protein n=1 Tax=Phytohabitans sp. LJ34 TaxID=3452217 RepID=UPI003F896C2D
MAMAGDRWLSAKAAERRARTNIRYQTGAKALRSAWRSGATENGWALEDWWVPGVDALTRALIEGRAATSAYAQLGRERAESGHGIRATLADVFTLHQQMASSDRPPAPAIRALAQAWAAATLAPVRVMLCADFASPAQLRAGFIGLFRDALPDGLAVLVVEAPQPATNSEWETVTLLLEASARTPSVFAAEAPMARTSPQRAVALVRYEAGPTLRRAGLKSIQLVPLPRDLSAAGALVAQAGKDQD